MEEERERLLAAERAARRQAQEADRLRDEFPATLGHELRTPLNAIVGCASLLCDGGPSSADAAKGLWVIRRSARAQAQLVDDLLDVSRIASSSLPASANRKPACKSCPAKSRAASSGLPARTNSSHLRRSSGG